MRMKLYLILSLAVGGIALVAAGMLLFAPGEQKDDLPLPRFWAD